jgi:hypothetical protein
MEHLAFKGLFKKDWVAGLRDRLEGFIAEEERLLRGAVEKLT